MGSRVTEDPRYHVFVNDVGGAPNIAPSVWTILPAINFWRSFGATGSGASHVWIALDSVPIGAEWIAVSLKFQIGNISAASLNGLIYGRRGGSAHNATADTVVAGVSINFPASGTVSMEETSTIFLPINHDSTRGFDLWVAPGAHTASIDMILTGYGWNRPPV